MLKKIVAIGDIHGCTAQLKKLLGKIQQKWEWDELVFLGDYVDRGPDSKGVIEEIISWQKQYPGRVIALKGNHEQWMLHALRNPCSTSWLIGMSGVTTIASYSQELAQKFSGMLRLRFGDWQEPQGNSYPSIPLPYEDFFYRVMPTEHLQFLQNLQNYYQAERAIFVHAGVDNDKPLEAQDEDAFLWSGEDFVKYYHGKEWVIFGHCVTDTLREDCKPRPYIGKNHVIGIDTGNWRTGVLTAYRWPDGAVLST